MLIDNKHNQEKIDILIKNNIQSVYNGVYVFKFHMNIFLPNND